MIINCAVAPAAWAIPVLPNFIALDDDMDACFGGEQLPLMTRFNFPDEVPIENSLISRSFDQIQAKVENLNFDASALFGGI